MKRAALVLALLLAPAIARATGFTDETDDLGPRDHDFVVVDGTLRLRGNAFYNLDLDRGLTPSGQALFPVNPSHPGAQTLGDGDSRVRADLAAFRPAGSLALKARVDLLDGGTMDGAPAAIAAPGSVHGIARLRRAYGELLTPVGLLSVGRIGSSWGVGMLTNGGDAPDADRGDSADGVAFVTPLAGMLWAASFDVASIGQDTALDARGGDAFDRADRGDTLSLAMLRWRNGDARARRAAAGIATVDWGAVFSHRTMKSAPAWGGGGQSLPRGLTADGLDGWLRVSGAWGRVEAESALLKASVAQASTIPGVLLHQPIRALQSGAALESDFGGARLSAGLDLGYASGDPAPGFGARVVSGATAPQPGDLDGPQATLPGDANVDNFRFHPEYRIDRILFHEIVGTVTDAVYLRPHVQGMLHCNKGDLTGSVAAIGSRAVYASSTPGGKAPLGVEIDPTLAWHARSGFALALEHGVLFPLAGLDNPSQGLRAKPAQYLRARLEWRFP